MLLKLRCRFNRLWERAADKGTALAAILREHWMASVIATVIIFAFALWKIPEIEVSPLRAAHGVSALDVFMAEDRARSTLAQIMGGAIVLAGLGFTGWRIEVARQGQITERFTRAVEQLGSTEMPVRVGAIYAFERLARESERDRWSIVDLLSAFVRHRCPINLAESSVPGPRVPADAQAAITVLGRLVSEEDLERERKVDLSESDLRGANLDAANLPGVRFTGSRLDGASLVGANLRKAVLVGASMEMANLMHANLELADLEELHASHADFSDASLAGAQIKHARLEGADLAGADIDGMILTSTHLEGADLRDTVGIPFLFPIPLAEVFVDERTQLPPHLIQWVIQNTPNRRGSDD
jgi:hypothetical protein